MAVKSFFPQEGKRVYYTELQSYKYNQSLAQDQTLFLIPIPNPGSQLELINVSSELAHNASEGQVKTNEAQSSPQAWSWKEGNVQLEVLLISKLKTGNHLTFCFDAEATIPTSH